MNDMKARELRDLLLNAAGELNAHRLNLLATINQINESTRNLVNEAERLLPAAVAEGPVDRPRATKPRSGEVEGIAKVDPKLEYIAVGTKKRRKPLSPERKAQLTETLKKARAARQKKKGGK